MVEHIHLPLHTVSSEEGALQRSQHPYFVKQVHTKAVILKMQVIVSHISFEYKQYYVLM